jgi:hypothetical protein
MAVDIAFSRKEKLAFLHDVLFPMAGFKPEEAESYIEIRELFAKLNFAVIQATRNYIEGKKTKDETIEWLKKYNLDSDKLASQRVRSMDVYRSYIVNYALGKKVINTYLEKKKGNLWDNYIDVLKNPRPASFFPIY